MTIIREMDERISESNENQSYDTNAMASESGEAEKPDMLSADEHNVQENIQDNTLICNAEKDINDPPSDEILCADVDDDEFSKRVEENVPTTKSIEGDTTKSSILRKHLLEIVIDKDNSTPVTDAEEGEAESISEAHQEESIVENITEENLDKKSSCDDENVDVFPSKEKVPCEVESVNEEEGKDLEVIELDQDKSSELIELDQDSNSVIEADKSKPTENVKVTEEKNCQNVPETEMDVTLEEPANHSNSEQNDKVSEELELSDVDPIAVDSKTRKRGRQKRDPQQLEQNCTGNGVLGPENEDLDDSNAGRPRRKAAQKAGDQIRQMVGIEDDVTEVVYDKNEDAEEWNEGTSCSSRMVCFQCCRLRSCQYHLLVHGVSRYLCTTPCFQAFRKRHPRKFHPAKNNKETELKDSDPVPSAADVGAGGDVRSVAEGRIGENKERVLECAFCHLIVLPPTTSEKSLSWETMEFCNEDCLGKYQDQLGSNCSQCKVPVQRISMGKYCVRFGYNIKQFCCSTCLEEFKKGLKACTYCQKDISTGAEGFLAPVGDKGQFKDFCSPACMEKYDHISSGTRSPVKEAACAVCDKVHTVFVEVVTGRLGKEPSEGGAAKAPNTIYSLCSEPCFAAFKFVNQVKTEQCESCQRYFDTSKPEEKPTTFFYDGGYHCCCRACLNIFILTRRSIVQCNWCRVKKYDFDMIKRISSSGQVLMMCSLNCLNLYHVSISAVSSRRVRCDFCNEVSQAQYHLTMSDATVRNFCSYDCVMTFQSQYSKTPLTLPDEDMTSSPQNSTSGLPSQQVSNQKSQPVTVQSGPVPAKEADSNTPPIPIISSIQSLAPADRNVPKEIAPIPVSVNLVQPESIHSAPSGPKVTGPSNGLALRQVIVMPPSVKSMRNKITSCKPIVFSKSTNCRPSMVDESSQTDEFVPRGPVIIPVPVPIYVPMPMHMYSSPFPVPVPFPLPIPVPVVVPAKLSIEEIFKRSKEFSSVTPEEAEILMMAELVVADEEQKVVENNTEPEDVPSPMEESGDLLHPEAVSDSEAEDKGNMVDLIPSSDHSVDLEESITVSTVHGPAYSEGEPTDEQQESEMSRGRKRKASEQGSGSRAKQIQSEDDDDTTELKASLGVSAWQVWVQQKNSELSKVTSNSRRLKLFKTELLQMTLEELNYALCLFVKEVRKPGGGMYAPDTILYFCLGIQHYLMENGRIDNIFTDLYFEKFTECLDQVAKNFPPLTKETILISTRVEEEHLWESRQLGAHSPYVLLSTLVFFNTKYFHLWTVEDHAKLTFANVVKVWRKPRGRPPETAKAGSSVNRPSTQHSILRYIHPDEEPVDGKAYEQHENLTTPLRCPVKLYEFYLSKCPEPIRRGGDVFYLLPERACVPDSPVWYSSIALGSDALGKILHRIHMVKEINKANISELSEETSAVTHSPEVDKEKSVDEKKDMV